MKVLSIGRENECDIVLKDSTDVISRRHAVLNIYPSGKMTIIDQGHNGTYVNGIRISPNTPYPITRKDSISFAHVMPLDWSQVPNQRGRIVYTILGIFILLVVAAVTTFFIPWGGNFKDNHTNSLISDSVKTDSIKKEKTAKVDSLKDDSIAKTKSAKRKQQKKGTPAPKKNVSKRPTDKRPVPKKDMSKQRGDTVKQRII